MERKQVNDEKLLEKETSSTSVCTRNAEALQEIESVNRVFDNPLLMDKIVKYSIYNSSGKKFSTQTIVGLRLVNKGWLQSTSRVLGKSGEWTIDLHMSYISGVRNVNGNTKDLNEFVSVFSKVTRVFDSILPIKLIFRQERKYSEHLTNLLEQCSEMICSIYLVYPVDGDSIHFDYSNFNFAILRDIEFHFRTLTHPVTNEENDPISENNGNGLKLIQQIMQSSPNLQRFALINDDEIVDVNFCSIVLPATVKALIFNGPITESVLTTLTKGQLPSLNKLELSIYEQADIHLIYKILEHFQQQLTSLYISRREVDDCNYDKDNTGVCIKLPLMEKLKTLHFYGRDFSLFPELRQVWLTLIPNVTHLILEELSETWFLEWVQGCQFENVKKLRFSLSVLDDDGYSNNTLSPTVQTIKEVIRSFPKLEKLTLTFQLKEISSLKYIFGNFTHLKKLSMCFEGGGPNSYNKYYELVSIFLGISLELATAIVEKTVEDVQVAVDNPESIMNLTELNSLTLKTPAVYYTEYLHSEFISTYGLSKMPKLQKIKLLGGFEQRQ